MLNLPTLTVVYQLVQLYILVHFQQYFTLSYFKKILIINILKNNITRFKRFQTLKKG